MAGNSRYPAELRERAVALVAQYERELGGGRGAIARVARDLGVHKEALRHWVKQAKTAGVRYHAVMLEQEGCRQRG
ncbi:transposase [Nocardia sp. SYP-A9097]|uniref:transposase n=1 Tax=Nocardia sp. SYP-A9097 TaxID=2663237 RepID=UPI00129B10AF|nr:transposase [Nocardia sp. SYP-A9097]MRH92305.1 transposase [Nocardia sp. SYP-A9097]